MARFIEVATCPRCGHSAGIYCMNVSWFRHGKLDAFSAQCLKDTCRVGVPFMENGETVEQVVDMWNNGVNLWRAGEPWNGSHVTRQMEMKEVEL